ncbi:MAG: hypothetical protein RLZZ271_831 [Pseudomonadota bacterium]|jgi:two-component system response regulator AlgR
MNILIADDEALARRRLRQLLEDTGRNDLHVLVEAANATEALHQLGAHAIDLVFIDIQMPGMNGLQLARTISSLRPKPHVVFVTAHPEHALTAFDLSALDYLTKPVRLERLSQCLAKVPASPTPSPPVAAPAEPASHLLIHERLGLVRVPLNDVLYFKAEQKYITVRTAAHTHLLEGSLLDLEQQYAGLFIRIHRNALVQLSQVQALLKAPSTSDDEGWQVQLRGIDERLAVSRRQLTAVKEALHKIGA